jgi:hypothetical protein
MQPDLVEALLMMRKKKEIFAIIYVNVNDFHNNII